MVKWARTTCCTFCVINLLPAISLMLLLSPFSVALVRQINFCINITHKRADGTTAAWWILFLCDLFLSCDVKWQTIAATEKKKLMTMHGKGRRLCFKQILCRIFELIKIKSRAVRREFEFFFLLLLFVGFIYSRSNVLWILRGWLAYFRSPLKPKNPEETRVQFFCCNFCPYTRGPKYEPRDLPVGPRQ